MIEELPGGECHLWLARASEILPPDVLVRYESWLTGDERIRYQSFRFERHRHLFLMTRGLVRQSLSRYADVHPADWRFGIGAHGKPFVSSPLASALSFNLSNTAGMVVCAVTRGIEVGVDVENTARLGDPAGIANRFFSPREVRDLHRLPAARQRERFFAYWTLKEAYIKARGLGLAIPLDQFSFSIGEQKDEIGLEIDPRLGDDASRWQCARIAVAPPHALAILLRRQSAENSAIRIGEVADCGSVAALRFSRI